MFDRPLRAALHRRASVLIIVTALIVALGATRTGTAATGSGVSFAPDEIITSLTATQTGSNRGDVTGGEFAWVSPERYRSITTYGAESDVNVVIVRRGQSQTGFGSRNKLTTDAITRSTFASPPDGISWFDYEVQEGIAAMLARHRAGTSKLVDAMVDSEPMLRGRVQLPANECAGLAKGRLTVWLDPRTLLARRSTEVRGGTVVRRTSTTYAGLNEGVDSSLFEFIASGETSRYKEGFTRATPQASDDKLPYQVRVPRFLPDAFTLVVSGWAPMSAVTGPEASIEKSPNLFAAVYRRGWERIDVTQRSATRDVVRAWNETSPYGVECGRYSRSKVSIRGRDGWYETDAQSAPRVYWKRGNVLHTVQGPFPKATLVKIASSLGKPA